MNPVLRGKMKHRCMQFKKFRGMKNPAAMLTKVVTLVKLKLCMTSTGLHE